MSPQGDREPRRAPVWRSDMRDSLSAVPGRHGRPYVRFILPTLLSLIAVVPAQCLWGPTGTTMAGWGAYEACAADLGSGARIYVGGNFSSFGGVAAHSIASWDGVQWSAMGSGFPSAIVWCLKAWDDGSGIQLYCGGTFFTNSGAPADGLARWNGTQWSDVGGLGGTVYDFEVFDDGTGPALHIAGRSLSANGTPLGNVARWDGAQWTTVGGNLTHGNPLTAWVSNLATLPGPNGGELWAIGNFEFANGQPTNRLTRLVGGQWQPMLLGLSPTVPADLEACVGPSGPRLYLTGRLLGGGTSDVVLTYDGTSLQVSAPLTYASFLDVHDDGSGPALYVTRAGTATHRMDPNSGTWSQVPGPLVYGNRSGLASVTFGATSALLSLGMPQLNGVLQGAHTVVCNGGASISLRQASPGAPITVTSANLIEGVEYYNFASLDPCPILGAGPYGGLCAGASLPFLQQQLAMPLGAHPFHFRAHDQAMTFDPILAPAGLIIDAICVRLTGGTPEVSAVKRLSVQ